MKAGKKLLVVNDEQVMLDAMARWLSSAGYRVECCLLGRIGVELAKKSNFDMIILDYHLKKEGAKTAKDFIPQFKNVRPAVPIIVVSATVQHLDKAQLGVSEVLLVNSTFWLQLISLIEKKLN